MRPAHWIYTIPLRLRSLFCRRVVERELDEELRYHIERQVDANLAHGMDLDEARYAALRAMGGLELRKEQCRDTRRVNLADTVAQDLRYAGRVLRRSPAFTVVAVLSLALGIGAATAVFSVVDGVLLARLPVRDPERLVNLRERVPPARTVDEFAREEYVRLRDETRVFSGLTTVALFVVAAALMWDDGAVDGNRLTLVVALHAIGVGVLALSGWLGGEMVFKHHLAVVPDDAELEREEHARHDLPAAARR